MAARTPMAEREPVVRRCATLMTAARRLGVPILVSEQYPKGLGATVPELAALASPAETVAKLAFSGAAEPALAARIDALAPRRQAVVCGIEAHVCVLQTALGLAARGFDVAVATDATSSRKPEDRDVAPRRLAAAGVTPVTTEMVVFEWLARAGTPAFRELSALIR